MTGHSIVGPALMKWHSCEMVVAWCAGRACIDLKVVAKVLMRFGDGPDAR